MSKIIFLPFRGNVGGGGPHIFVHKFAIGAQKKGYRIIYDFPQKADVALGIIESGKLLRKVNRAETKICIRVDGAYFKEYWHGGPGRAWRGDMTSLHQALQRDFNEKTGVDHVIFQSDFSRKLICSEIAERKIRYSVIGNRTDTNVFSINNIDKNYRDMLINKAGIKNTTGKIRLIHHAKMRNDYIMESLLGVLDEIKKRGHDVELLIAGNMDAECSGVYNKHNKKDVFYVGPIPNNKMPSFLSLGSIYVAPRMGSSSDNCVVEALSMSLACVLPLWGGNSELINDGKEGIIVNSGGHWNYGPGYIHKLADAVETIIPDLDNYKVRARKHACANLNLDTMVDKYLLAMGL